MRRVRVIGPGRAGKSLSSALTRAGWDVVEALGRGDDVAGAAEGVDLLVIATPDGVVSEVASKVRPIATTVVVHMAGSLGLEVLTPHEQRASIHPLVSLPDPEIGAERLLAGAWFAVSGDSLAKQVVESLGGHWFAVADADRARYHAAATIAANHLVALFGQVERIAADAGLPLEPFVELAAGTLDNVGALGPRGALTGPVARGDWVTVARHLASIPDSERPAYEALAAEAARLAETPTELGALTASIGGRRAQKLRDVEVITTAEAFRKSLDAERAAGKTVGLVPTMGYLHAGHASLIERAARECEVVAVTVFVNPLQFGPDDDLASYPRDLDGDVELARASGVSYVFAPPTEEMYPGPTLTTVSVAGISEPFEGASRPGHFAGVATVVAKLFGLAGACRAYFGEKDYQQLLVVRRLADDLSLPVTVVGCPTIREHDGLALSSRNAYLTAEQRDAAPLLHRALVAGREAIVAGERDPAVVQRTMTDRLDTEPLLEPDYLAAVSAEDLTVPGRLEGVVRLLVAARIGRARLIDNLGVNISP